MTREEFEVWLEGHVEHALDDVPQSDTTPQKWLGRLYAALYTSLKTSDEEEESDPEDEHDPEREAEDSNDEGEA